MVAPEYPSSIAARLHRVRDTIALAARRAGRDPSSITLLLATKGVAVERIEEAIRAGARTIGENRLQEALPKMAALASRHPDLEWHYIGTLQRRKIREIVGTFAMIQSVDSLAAAEEISRRAEKAGLSQRVLLEVNLGEEPTKSGFKAEEVAQAARACLAWQGLRIEGLMAIPPYHEDPEKTRPDFRRLRALAESLASERFVAAPLGVLSMGMSHDFEVAVEEGATMVRVGQAIFGARDG